MLVLELGDLQLLVEEALLLVPLTVWKITTNAALTAVATSADSDMSSILRARGQMLSVAGAAAGFGFGLGRLSTTFDFAPGSPAGVHGARQCFRRSSSSS